MTRVSAGLAAGLATLLLALPGGAYADSFVNDQGSDLGGNDCAAAATPCETIQRGVAQAGPGETVWVEDGTYDEEVVLGEGKSLRRRDFDPGDSDTAAVISPPPGFPAIQVTSGNPAGTVQGFFLRSNGSWAVALADAATIEGNTLDQLEDGTPGIQVLGGAGAPRIADNTLETSAGVTHGIQVNGSSPIIEGNELSGFALAIDAPSGGDSTPRIIGNTITGSTTTSGTAYGIRIGDSAGAAATLRGNVVRDPDPSVVSVGIEVADDPLAVVGAGAELDRNTVLGQDIGVRVVDTYALSMHGDLVAQNGVGVTAADKGGDDDGDVDATNVTAFDNGTDIQLDSNALSLDSSIVGDEIAETNAVSCTITSSRGPAPPPVPPPSGCADFQTSADPGFMDAASGDYHLLASSAMIDAGNPAPPPPVATPPAYAVGSLDIDGQPRALDGDCDGTARRDIGADERAGNCAPADSGAPTDPGGSPGDGTDPSPATPPEGDPASTPSPDRDTDPPETRIKRAKVRRHRVKLRFASDESGSTFTCKLDRRKARPCTSPKRYRKLRPGKHRVKVRATDAAGNAEERPAKARFRVR